MPLTLLDKQPTVISLEHSCETVVITKCTGICVCGSFLKVSWAGPLAAIQSKAFSCPECGRVWALEAPKGEKLTAEFLTLNYSASLVDRIQLKKEGA